MYQRHFPHTKDRFSNGSITIHQHDAFRPAAHRQHDPWWEIEARERITSGDIQSLDAVFRYHLYGPTDALLATLRKCTKERLNDIFNRLSHAETCCEPMQSVEGIANLVEPYYESPSPTPKGWEPREMRGLDAEGIANTINNRSVELLSHIEFQDYLRYAFGYTQDSVDQAIIQHRIITWTTWCYLGEYPEMMTTYKEVKQKLHGRNALAYQAVSTSLLDEFNPNACLNLIYEPIRQGFNDARRFSDLLETLSILQDYFNRLLRK